MKGDVLELGTNVYMYGTKNQSETYTKTTKAIAEYVGKTYSKAMRLLVKDGKESPEQPPKEPRGTHQWPLR